jgi:hexosaminidase
VLQEVMQLFPSTYIHTGGDEVPFSQWRNSAYVHSLMQREHLQTYPQVQSYFERRIEQFIESKGRRMMGWDEVLEGGLSTRAGIMSWRGISGGTAAAKKGNDVVMTPDGPLYFDAYQGDPDDEPEAIGNLSTPQMVHAFDPVPAELTPAQAAHILGVQGNLWAEYIGTPEYLFYMLLPRELALADIAWSRQPGDWNAFEARTRSQYAWLERNKYNFRIPNPAISLDGASTLGFDNVHPSVRTTSVHVSSSDLTVNLSDPVPDATLLFSTDGNTANRTYGAPLRIALRPGEHIVVTAVARLRDGRTSTPSALEITRDL